MMGSTTRSGGSGKTMTFVRCERITDFAGNTETVGTERIFRVNNTANSLMAAQDSGSASTAEWKDSPCETWHYPLELTETHTWTLVASQKLHQFFLDCNDEEKKLTLGQHSNALSTSVSAQQKHGNPMQDLQTLQCQVPQFQKQSSYTGGKAKESSIGEAEVIRAGGHFIHVCVNCRLNMADTGDSLKFFIVVGTPMPEMNDAVRQMNAPAKPSDVCGVGIPTEKHHCLGAQDSLNIFKV